MKSDSTSLTGIPGIGRATVIGAIAGAVLAGAIVAVALLVAGARPIAIVASAHVGFFGGMGYGGMLGAVLQSDRFDANGRPHQRGALSAKTTGRSSIGASMEGVRHAYLHV